MKIANNTVYLEDSMPTVCDCGNVFNLYDGYRSIHSPSIVCFECAKAEYDDEDKYTDYQQE